MVLAAVDPGGGDKPELLTVVIKDVEAKGFRYCVVNAEGKSVGWKRDDGRNRVVYWAALGKAAGSAD